MSNQTILTTVASVKYLSSYHNIWFTDEAFLSILKSRLNLPDSVTKYKLNRVLSKHEIDFDSDNTPKIYHLFRRRHYVNSTKGKMFCYYICSNEHETRPCEIGIHVTL